MPPTRLVRYCCDVLKEQDGYGRMIATGVRWAESVKRKRRDEFEVLWKRIATASLTTEMMLSNDNDMKRRFMEHCDLKAKSVVNPIIDWSDKEVFDYYYSECKLHNPLYERGYKRIGCIGCPMAGKHRYKEFRDYPTYKRAYIRAFDKMIAERRSAGLKIIQKTGEEVFNWWMEDKNIMGQITLDDYIKKLPS